MILSWISLALKMWYDNSPSSTCLRLASCVFKSSSVLFPPSLCCFSCFMPSCFWNPISVPSNLGCIPFVFFLYSSLVFCGFAPACFCESCCSVPELSASDNSFIIEACFTFSTSLPLGPHCIKWGLSWAETHLHPPSKFCGNLSQ